MRGRKKTPQKSHHSKAPSGQIRIIGGQHRGRKLPVHDVTGLRPTTDRVKETVFNWLMMDVRDANVLDCFAGAGSLGFEALSRFAAKATLIELDNTAAKQLEENAQLLKLSNVDIINTNAITFVQQMAQQSFDLVFVDPPFNQNLSTPCCEALEENNWLSEQALVYVEVESDNQDFSAPANWQLFKEKVAGQVWCRLYRRN
ncbi:16S rRNA (guanine(966)-N(2))-methyltransferase RsmD [Pseudoalteromonas sp. SSDWG2]|uniref:16S rRNA (guanine(966)-N(2))-methyltransferase RsmD n=1 Tax=Pseudoalteromonas sp. SSDWG2 TaxID=3139391 RepID=UPI003BA848D7